MDEKKRTQNTVMPANKGKASSKAVGNGSNKPAPQNGQPAYPPSNPPRAATQSQLKAIMAIAKRLRINPVQLARDRFQVRRPEDLSIQQASAIIDELKNSPTR